MRRLEEALLALAEQDERLPTSELITRIEQHLSGEWDSTVVALPGRSMMDTIEETRRAERRRRWIPAVVAAGAAVLVLIVIGLPILLFGGGDSEFIGESTVPPSTVPETTIPPTAQAWQRVGADVMDPAAAMLDLASAGRGLVGVGVDPGEDFRQDGAVFASEDGVTWTRLAEEDPALTTGSVVPLGVAETEDGLVVVGWSCEDDAFPCEAGPYPTVWTSVEGSLWTRSAITTDLGQMEDLVVTDYGVVAAGWTQTPIVGSGDEGEVEVRPAVWLAPDGADWELVWEGDPVVTEPPVGVNRMLALAAGPDGLIVGVGSAENELGEEIAAAWISDNGQSWERIDPEGSGSDAGLGVSMVDVASGPAGFIAVGNEDATEIAVWQSPDGRGWTRVDIADLPNDTGALGAVAAFDSGWVATGFGPGFGERPVSLWTSPDGFIWNRAVVLDPGYAQAIVVTDTEIAMAGGIFEAEDFHAAVWVGTIAE